MIPYALEIYAVVISGLFMFFCLMYHPLLDKLKDQEKEIKKLKERLGD